MNTAALLIGRVVIAGLLGILAAVIFIGLLDIVTTLWRLVWPEYRSFVVPSISSLCTWVAWRLVKHATASEGAKP